MRRRDANRGGNGGGGTPPPFRNDSSQDLRHHEPRGRDDGGRGWRRRARLHLRREHAALRDARDGGSHRARAAAVRHDGRHLLGSSGGSHQGGPGGVWPRRSAAPRRREAGGPRGLLRAGDQDDQAPGLSQARGRPAARQRRALERGRGAPAHRMDDRPRPGQRPVADHPRGGPDAGERRPRRRDCAPLRRRRGLGSRGAAGPQGPRQGVAVRRRGQGRAVKKTLPDAHGHFGRFGGRFVPETLMAPLIELEQAWAAAKRDRKFQRRLADLLRDYAGRPTPLYFAQRLSEQCGGARIYLKREDLCHTGAHKINSVLGQALLAERMGKRRVIAETGAGQHGVATATAAALLGLECEVYMGAEDVERQALNVFRMRLLGARVISVESGSRTLKDAINEALRDWVTNVRTTYYLLGSALGPHPYPVMVRDLHSVIGREARRQARAVLKKLPDVLVACVGGGSNAIGLFHPFIGDRRVRIVGVEPGGEGIATGRHGASMSAGAVGVLHGCMSYLLQSDDGQIATAHSISAGLDYPGVGPEHAYYRDQGRFEFVSATDAEALEGFEALTRLEGIMPALESAHAVAYAMKLAKTLPRTKTIVVGLSGRGDKDVHVVAKALGKQIG